MKYLLTPIFALAMIAFLASSSVQAENQEKMIIALKTSDFELAETDISSLAIGEAKTIETESGRIIDILRTNEGAEIYVDGELLEMDFDDEGLHEGHQVRKHVEVICTDDEECEENVIVLAGEDSGTFEIMSGHGDKVFIHEEIELSCSDDEEGSSCSEHKIWTTDGEEVDLKEIHEKHEGDKVHKVIVIKKEVVTED